MLTCNLDACVRYFVYCIGGVEAFIIPACCDCKFDFGSM